MLGDSPWRRDGEPPFGGVKYGSGQAVTVSADLQLVRPRRGVDQIQNLVAADTHQACALRIKGQMQDPVLMLHGREDLLGWSDTLRAQAVSASCTMGR